jgi:hypothetical protein
MDELLTINGAVAKAQSMDLSNPVHIKLLGLNDYDFKKPFSGFDGYWMPTTKAYNYNLFGRLPFNNMRFDFNVPSDNPEGYTNIEADLHFIDGYYKDDLVFIGWIAILLRRVDDTVSVNNSTCLIRFDGTDMQVVVEDQRIAREFAMIALQVQNALLAIHSGCEAKLCRTTDKQKRINERRIKDGKKPVYEEQTIKIKPSIYYKPTGQHRNYTPPCAHQRRGHFRTYQSGKRVWVKDCKVSQGSERTVKSDYVFEYDVV